VLRTERDGFRLRGEEMTRIETFTDAAFAFAVSLLVIAGDTVPGHRRHRCRLPSGWQSGRRPGGPGGRPCHTGSTTGEIAAILA
jgi:hypothetical protein